MRVWLRPANSSLHTSLKRLRRYFDGAPCKKLVSRFSPDQALLSGPVTGAVAVGGGFASTAYGRQRRAERQGHRYLG